MSARPAAGTGCATTLCRRHALAIEVDLANPFDPGQHVIGGLTAHTHQFGADNSGHEIARQIQNFLRGCAFKSLAKNRRHCPGKGLHFGPERHPNVGLAIFIDLQINADGVRAFLVFADILQIELLALARLLFPRVAGIGDERLRRSSSGSDSKRLMILFSLGGYIEDQNLPRL